MKKHREIATKRDIIFALSGGVLLSAAQPPLFSGFLSFFCLIPLFMALRRKCSFSAFALGYLWGFTSNLLSLYWIALPTFAGMVAAVIILSLYNALFALAYSFVERRSEPLALGLAPIFWVGMEFMRGYGQLGFPWMDLAYSLGRYPVFIQIADIFGHLGISLWIVAVNALIFAILIAERRRLILAVSLIVIFTLPLLYGIICLRRPAPEDTIRIALMQGNVPAEQKWESRRANVNLYAAMIDSLDAPVDLIVLPETATAVYHRNYPAIISVLQSASERAGAPILAGSLDFDPERRSTHYYNAAVLVEAQHISESYHKMELVPMSERIPFEEKLTFLRDLDVGGSHFARGERYFLFDVGGWKFGAPICFESAFSRSSLGFAREGANFLVNITNDDWFGMTPGPYQHANFSRFRAVETRLSFARCAQTGISLFADEKGRITQSLPLQVKGALVGEIGLSKRMTFFARNGQWLGSGSLIATPLILMLIGLLLKN
ncbi:MAG TPA: apolipoprotein N-acyltransferase [candidate division Zixibacteria bacterium]|nr:apolipoprotein N-acyltransferase [candidate division Zixibacteria bacterium]